MSLQSWQAAKRIIIPHAQQILLVLPGPFLDQALGTQWQVALDHLQRVHIEHTIELAIHSMEVRSAMLALAEVHLDDDSIEPRNDWHRRLQLQGITEIRLSAIDQDLDNLAFRSYSASNAAFFCWPAGVSENTSGNAPRMWSNSAVHRSAFIVHHS
jgi:hypothetical protein